MDLLRKKKNALLTDETTLVRTLSTFDLMFLGIGAIIGAGIFVITGVVASTTAGPAIVFSYVLAGIACALSALCYAELATSIGGCGSAYAYAYVSFGELFAWIVGWDLLLEYSVSTAAVAVGWSSYFHDLLSSVHIPISPLLLEGPLSGGAFNLFAFMIVVILAFLLSRGVQSSARINNAIVIIKLMVLTLFIVIAVFHVNTSHWVPFMPFGWTGVFKGASLVFFAYIGFDAVSTAAEETRNPQHSLPIGIIGSLVISTMLYMIVSVLLTGIVSYTELNNASPISRALIQIGFSSAASIICLGALAGLTTVIFVLFYGLSRIFFAMSRDGLLPRYFAVLHPKTKSPQRIIYLCAICIGSTASMLPITLLATLVNIGTLFTFSMVCCGVIILRFTQPDLPRPFKVPGMPYLPALGIVSCLGLMTYLPLISIVRFIVWFTLGLSIYFLFARKHSLLNRVESISTR